MRNITRFQVGQTYRIDCGYGVIFELKVVRRTERTIFVVDPTIGVEEKRAIDKSAVALMRHECIKATTSKHSENVWAHRT